jgi:cobalt-zinc-cadmium efflux system outer membrane protein
MLAATSVAVHADPALCTLLRQSLDRAPALLEQAANLRASRAEARQAHAWANPTLGWSSRMWAAVPPTTAPARRKPPFRSPSRWNWPGGTAHCRRKRRCARDRGTGAQVRYDYAAQLALAYATAEAMQARLTLAQDDVARAGEDLRAAKALVAAGKEARLRAAQAQAGLSPHRPQESASADLPPRWQTCPRWPAWPNRSPPSPLRCWPGADLAPTMGPPGEASRRSGRTGRT